MRVLCFVPILENCRILGPSAICMFPPTARFGHLWYVLSVKRTRIPFNTLQGSSLQDIIGDRSGASVGITEEGYVQRLLGV